jgi:hypothetical protein
MQMEIPLLQGSMSNTNGPSLDWYYRRQEVLVIALDFSIQLIQDVKTEQVVIQILELPIGSATHLVVQEKVQAVPLMVTDRIAILLETF